ncbi:MAG: glycosyltransferase family 4 protein [Chitinophagales bacterium]
MKIAYIGTYPPRECGIGTFTRNKFLAMIDGQDGRHEGMIIAMNDQEGTYDYPDEVKFVIQYDRQEDYIEAADFINASGADICIIEHEFGIFGGESGIYLLPLLHRLKMPLITVLHTVLKNPSYNQRSVLMAVSRISDKTVVMTHKAVGFLTDIYGIPINQIEVIEHGVPDFKFDQAVIKNEFNLSNKKVLLTFGLISRNKGIETVIKALPSVVAKYPDVVYIVLGKTHPTVLRHSGEEYRDSLVQLVKELHLEGHVVFMNEFVNEERLFKYLTAADIYVTPYLNEAQITSGTLSYAVGAGCAIISTPYWHASELTAKVGGRLFQVNNDLQLASVFMDVLGDPGVMNDMRKRAYAYGSEITWSKTGERYLRLSQAILEQPSWKSSGQENFEQSVSFPMFSLDHVRRMTDNTGIIQHTKYGIPNLKEGYCLDDNARALLMVLMAHKHQKNFLSTELLRVYLSYIHYMQKDDGSFHNFLGYNRNYLDEQGSEDSFGRTIWALGYLIANPPNDSYHRLGREMFHYAKPHFKELKTSRGIANTLIGTCYYLQTATDDTEMTREWRDLSSKLMDQYVSHKTTDWKWFEPVLTYDNAILPLSLLHAAGIKPETKIIEIAKESMHFLSDITLRNGYLSVIGNEKWYAKGGKQSVFAQQPIDVMATILMFQKAFQLTLDRTYLRNLYTAFRWFLGENDLGMNLHDHEMKGCFDGLECYGVNRNQGAESTLAYLISHVALLETIEKSESLTLRRKNLPLKNEPLSFNMAKMTAL